MAKGDSRVIPTERELQTFDLNDPAVVDLIHRAQEGDLRDRQLTVRQALKKYKRAVFWAMILSTSLIMEGYDVVRKAFANVPALDVRMRLNCTIGNCTVISEAPTCGWDFLFVLIPARSRLFMARSSLKIASAFMTKL